MRAHLNLKKKKYYNSKIWISFKRASSSLYHHVRTIEFASSSRLLSEWMLTLFFCEWAQKIAQLFNSSYKDSVLGGVCVFILIFMSPRFVSFRSWNLSLTTFPTISLALSLYLEMKKNLREISSRIAITSQHKPNFDTLNKSPKMSCFAQNVTS